MKRHLYQNMSCRDALRIAEDLGCTIRQTEEIIVRHPTWSRSVRIHVGRKDVSKALLSKLRQLAAKEDGWATG